MELVIIGLRGGLITGISPRILPVADETPDAGTRTRDTGVEVYSFTFG